MCGCCSVRSLYVFSPTTLSLDLGNNVCVALANLTMNHWRKLNWRLDLSLFSYMVLVSACLLIFLSVCIGPRPNSCSLLSVE